MASSLYPISVLLAVFLLLLRAFRRRPTLPLPPGPKGLPIVGNLFQVPYKLTWWKLVQWSKKYGPIYSYTLMGQPIVVLSGLKEAADILDRLSAKTSDRPRLIKAGEFMCREMEFGFATRNELWRKHRRAAHESLNVRVAKDFQPLQEEESRILITGLLEHPEVDIIKHIHRHSASIAWRVLYGHESIPLLGPNPTAILDKFFRELFFAGRPGGSVVDLFPFLAPLVARSSWLRRESDRFFEQANTVLCKAHRDPQLEGYPSFCKKMKETGERIGMGSDEDCGWAAGSLFLAAQDTTATALRWFWVAMLCYPETAIPARAQLDAVCGNRPPTFEDYDNLPYIEAMVKELLRWRPSAPAGVAHMANEDIVYEGYLLPKGTIFIPNEWSLGRDPSIYPNGDTFSPSRFLTPSGRVRKPPKDTKDDAPAFGHGRRICIGKTVALHSLWITLAYLLWAFEFERVKDEQGRVVVPDEWAFWDNGLTVRPRPFECRLVPRFGDLGERVRGEKAE